MNFNLTPSLISLFAALCIGFAVEAQELQPTPTQTPEQPTYQLPGAHADSHQELIAGQVNIGKQIKVDATIDFINNIFEPEEEPEMDIYTEGWDSGQVNPYVGMDVPDTQDIDVSRFCMPHPGYVTSNYGYRKRYRRQHKGIDIKVYTGDTIRSAFDGRVRLTKYERRGYGYYVIVRHTNGLETVYGHLSKFLVEPDQYVKAGEPIALGGNTGRSTGSHLHLETRYMGYAINPAAIFDIANQTVHTDIYTFTKDTYTKARNYDPAANSEYAKAWRAANPRPTHEVASASSSSGGSSVYRVRKGDTLSRIASRNGVSVRQICRLNGITTKSTLRIGQRLKLR